MKPNLIHELDDIFQMEDNKMLYFKNRPLLETILCQFRRICAARTAPMQHSWKTAIFPLEHLIFNSANFCDHLKVVAGVSQSVRYSMKMTAPSVVKIWD